MQVAVIGGGMITHDQLLPSLYQLQRLGAIGEISICARRKATLDTLAAAPTLREAFPGQSFRARPGRYQDLIAGMAPGDLVLVAVPDPLHFEVILSALRRDQHVLSVKPLVLSYRDSARIEQEANARGLFVGVEYHKRFDRRALEARGSYRAGRFGEFKCGEAKLIEPWYYRNSNFQNWFIKKNTDPFTYIGCHYVDIVFFITGLRPVEVSVRGVEGIFPNGTEAWMWSNGRVRFENGGLLTVTNGLGYPDVGAGSNDQGMCLFCEGKNSGATIKHDDQFRGVQHCYVDGTRAFRFINPDYFRLVPWEGEGLRPVGYGYDSVEAHVRAARRLRDEPSRTRRRQMLAEIDDQGILATPKNSFVNELVIEAARISVRGDGRNVRIQYRPRPRVNPL